MTQLLPCTHIEPTLRRTHTHTLIGHKGRTKTQYSLFTYLIPTSLRFFFSDMLHQLFLNLASPVASLSDVDNQAL